MLMWSFKKRTMTAASAPIISSSDLTSAVMSHNTSHTGIVCVTSSKEAERDGVPVITTLMLYNDTVSPTLQNNTIKICLKRTLTYERLPL